MAKKEKTITYYIMELNLDKKLSRKLANLGLNLIVDDEAELINYSVNYLLRQAVSKRKKK
jgi:hypothetical protein